MIELPLLARRLRPCAIGIVLGAALPWVAAVGAADPGGPAVPLGFTATTASAEAELERRFDADLDPEQLRRWLEQLSAAPNHVGSPHDKANAEFLLRQFRAWGWEAAIERFSVLYPTPREELVELVAPGRFRAALREPAVDGDRTSVQVDDELPAYNAYGADGDVTAELVYVNQGMPDDYAELDRRGVSVKGRIVIARYGGGWRGLKPKLAAQHGAVGCLIYSDPRDDGYGAGDTYPAGGFRPREGVQRGSVQDMTLYSGDPLTPGVGATATARRLAPGDAKTILTIPSLPLSYADAEPLLRALGGRVAPPGWRGGLPFAYHTGPGPARVHLKLVSDWRQTEIYDVIAKIRGSTEPDRWIIRGNHHDAWVFGAADPLSGHVALMAEAKAIGNLVKHGWRPRRTLVYASWDAEEPGLVGSTEWVESHAAELSQKAVLYINSDMNGRGVIEVGGSHSLQRFASEAAGAVRDPETGASVLARALASRRVAAHEAGRAAEPGEDLRLEALGSGSDFTPFLQHLGIDSLNVEFRGESDYGVYHSAYDSFDHFRRFVDPSFQYGIALAEVTGRLVLRAAQADLLPARQVDFAASIAGYVDELRSLVDTTRTRNRELGRLLDAGDFALAADPRAPRAAPPRAPELPAVNFAALDAAVKRLQASAAAFDRDYARAVRSEEPAAGIPAAARATRARFNAALATLERTLTDSHGLPERDWYRHMIYAPGATTGYGVKTLPGIREALEEARWDDAAHYMGVVALALNAYSARLDDVVAGR